MEQHDARLEQVLRRVMSAGLNINKEKCFFRQSQRCFLGHLIDKSGVRPDPNKVGAIHQLPPPGNVQELKSPEHSELPGEVCSRRCNSGEASVLASKEQEYLDLGQCTVVNIQGH